MLVILWCSLQSRPPCIPAAVLARKEAMETDRKKRSLRDEELEMGDDFILELHREWDLKNEEEKTDIIPELWMGKNIADYVDPEIDAKLAELEEEEAMREAAGVYDNAESVSHISCFFHFIYLFKHSNSLSLNDWFSKSLCWLNKKYTNML